MTKEIYLVQPDGGETLLLSSLDASEAQELWEWYCYTKPIGPAVRLALKQDFRSTCCITAAGTLIDGSANARLTGCQLALDDEHAESAMSSE
jgi:hypothetical protein